MNIGVIVCPPLSKFKEQPSYMSTCTLEDCPKCGNKMWLSENKKSLIKTFNSLPSELIIGCYDCMRDFFKENPEYLVNAGMLDI